jgi:Protein of unknown function (DUF3732)
VIQLHHLALYSHHGDMRKLAFTSGSLNIITGESMTGKSALLEIVEFCLGRATVSLPEGALTRAVDWYAVIVGVGDQRAVVARPGPSEGQATVAGGYWAVGGPSLDFPSHDELHANINADGITEELSRMCGIEEYTTSGGQDPFQPTVRHASFFCFQRQNEIANATQLFHRQNEDFIPQAIRETLPYFLGAGNIEAPILRRRLTLVRRDLRKAERDLGGVLRTAELAPERGFGLVAEAVDLGLIAQPADDADLAVVLQEAADAPVGGVREIGSLPEEYERLRVESRELAEQLRAVGERAKVLLSAKEDRSDYEEELGEHAARLVSLKLLVPPTEGAAGGSDESTQSQETSTCPVCGSTLEEADATVKQLSEAVAAVSAELAGANEPEPARQDALAQLEDTAQGLRARMREVHEALSLLVRDRGQLQLLQDQDNARAYVKGRIVQHLDELQRVTTISAADLRLRVEALRASAAELETQLDPDAEREQVVSRLNVVGSDMTKWAEELGLEHSGGRVRLDAFGLTVVADTQDGPVPLERMGSAGNWVGYHLVTHLALHRWFVTKERPVPRILMLDQPTQAFYPPDVDEVAVQDMDDADRKAVTDMFQLLNEVTQELAPHLQIIVTDHANLEEDWFQSAIVEEWRHGNKLVPDEWLK